jgi:esterase/lipase superfamily enzyme
MGNLVLLQAFEKIGNQSPILRGLFGEIIQAAPDVDAARAAGLARAPVGLLHAAVSRSHLKALVGIARAHSLH